MCGPIPVGPGAILLRVESVSINGRLAGSTPCVLRDAPFLLLRACESLAILAWKAVEMSVIVRFCAGGTGWWSRLMWSEKEPRRLRHRLFRQALNQTRRQPESTKWASIAINSPA